MAMIRTFYHYSGKGNLDFQTVKGWNTDNAQNHFVVKPLGLWLSVRNSWEKWCLEEEFALDKLAHRYAASVDMNNILVLNNPQKIFNFHKKYILPFCDEHQFMDKNPWGNVQKEYSGILIAPYRKIYPSPFGLGSMLWHDAWDVSSLCLWNLDNLIDFALAKTKERKHYA